MALEKTLTKTQELFDGVLEVKNAYWRVENVNGSKFQLTVTVSANKKFGDEIQVVEFKSYVFTPNMSGDNFVKQAYEYLKTLPEFAGATDC